MIHCHIIRGDVFCFIADLRSATKKARTSTSCGLIHVRETECSMVSADLVIVLKRIETSQYQYKEFEWHVGAARECGVAGKMPNAFSQ